MNAHIHPINVNHGNEYRILIERKTDTRYNKFCRNKDRYGKKCMHMHKHTHVIYEGRCTVCRTIQNYACACALHV